MFVCAEVFFTFLELSILHCFGHILWAQNIVAVRHPEYVCSTSTALF